MPPRYTVKLPAGWSLRAGAYGNESVIDVVDAGGRDLGELASPYATWTDRSGTVYRAPSTMLNLTGATSFYDGQLGVRGSGVTPFVQWSWGWISATLYFNKLETAAIAVNSAAFIALVALFVPPPFDVVLGAISIGLGIIAGNALLLGACVDVSVALDGPHIGIYSGGYCT